MWLRLKLNVLLRAFRVYTDLKTASLYLAKGITRTQMDVQKLPCYLLDRHNLERRTPETVSGQNIKHGIIIGIPLYIGRCAQQHNRLHVKVSCQGICGGC
jgi:hypothetical protein